jgi:hypothetical protein
LKTTTYVGWDNIVTEDGFVNLFNGVDLQGWSMAGRGKFQIIEQERALVFVGSLPRFEVNKEVELPCLEAYQLSHISYPRRGK